MNAAGFIFLLVLHAVSGWGLVSLFGLELTGSRRLGLSLILGVFICSLVPFGLELFHIRQTAWNIGFALSLLAIVLGGAGVFKAVRSGKMRPDQPFLSKPFHLSEIPSLFVLLLLVGISVFRCYAYPPTPRDLLSGPEVIAEYTIREKTMVNSVFSTNLESTNNHLKPPYITSLQVVYKYFVQHYGQLWLSVLTVSFLLFLYDVLRERLHPLISTTLLMLFLSIPELYGYTHMALFDYSNMVLLFIGLYFLQCYFRSGKNREFFFAALLCGCATYPRAETLILVGMFLPLVLFHWWKNKVAVSKIIAFSLLWLLPALFFYLLPIEVYIRNYLPVQYTAQKDLRTEWILQPLAERFVGMNKYYIAGKFSVQFWGYFIYLFFLVFLLDAAVFRRISKDARFWLYCILVIYLGLPLLGYALPLFDLHNTTKRGLFKLMPMLLAYFTCSSALQWLSLAITRWELTSLKAVKPAAKPTPIPARAVPRQVSKPQPRKKK